MTPSELIVSSVPLQPAVRAESNADLPSPVHDCWNQIGVRGNGTCPELHQFVHCRNCPVHAAAARVLLDRPAWPEYLRERTLQFARGRLPVRPTRISVLVFRLGPEWLALPTVAFQEILERRSIHSLPHRRGGIVLGLVNVRGELVICVSLARLLGLEQRAAAGGSAGPPASNGAIPRLAVTLWTGSRLAFPVDEVHGVVRLAREEIHEPPATVGAGAATLTTGLFHWQERAVGFLDADGVFSRLNTLLS